MHFIIFFYFAGTEIQELILVERNAASHENHFMLKENMHFYS